MNTPRKPSFPEEASGLNTLDAQRALRRVLSSPSFVEIPAPTTTPPHIVSPADARRPQHQQRCEDHQTLGYVFHLCCLPLFALPLEESPQLAILTSCLFPDHFFERPEPRRPMHGIPVVVPQFPEIHAA